MSSKEHHLSWDEVGELKDKMDTYLASTYFMIKAIHTAELFLNMEDRGFFRPLIEEEA